MCGLFPPSQRTPPSPGTYGADMSDQLGKALSALGLVGGTVAVTEDYSQDFEVEVCISHDDTLPRAGSFGVGHALAMSFLPSLPSL